jgi:hypothetical protein
LDSNTKYFEDKSNIVVIVEEGYSKNVEHVVKSLVYNGRWKKILTIILAQTPQCIKKDIRQQFDFFFAIPSLSFSDMKSLYDIYFSIVDSFQTFKSIAKRLESCVFLCSGKKLRSVQWYSTTKSTPLRESEYDLEVQPPVDGKKRKLEKLHLTLEKAQKIVKSLLDSEL